MQKHGRGTITKIEKKICSKTLASIHHTLVEVVKKQSKKLRTKNKETIQKIESRSNNL